MTIATKIYTNLCQKWKNTRSDLFSSFGMNEQFFKNARGARIVIYHGICQDDHKRFNSIFLRVKTFKAHLQFYKKYFNIISLDDYYNGQFNKERFNICISFDDGFANNYKYVLPLMEKYEVPIGFFITCIRNAGYDILWNDFLCMAQKYGPLEFLFLNDCFHKNKYGQYVSSSGNKPLKDLLRETDFEKKAEMIKLLEPTISTNKIKEEDYWLQMTEEQIKILSASPFATIGCHGYYHNDLSMISIDKAKDEIILNKQWLENITAKKIDAIAFPYGAYTQKLLGETKSAGFKKLLATDFIFPKDNFDTTMRERLTINPYISVNNQMIAIIKGKYER